MSHISKAASGGAKTFGAAKGPADHAVAFVKNLPAAPKATPKHEAPKPAPTLWSEPATKVESHPKHAILEPPPAGLLIPPKTEIVPAPNAFTPSYNRRVDIWRKEDNDEIHSEKTGWTRPK